MSDTEVSTYRCLICGNPSDYCPGHGSPFLPCDGCEGWGREHRWYSAPVTGNVLCSTCHLLPLDSEDSESVCRGDHVEYHEPYCPHVDALTWVTIALIEGDEGAELSALAGEDFDSLIVRLEPYFNGDREDWWANHYHSDNGPWSGADITYTYRHLLLAVNEENGTVGIHRRSWSWT